MTIDDDESYFGRSSIQAQFKRRDADATGNAKKLKPGATNSTLFLNFIIVKC